MSQRRIYYLLFTGVLALACSRCPTIPESDCNRVVLAELFSFSGCTFCPNAEKAIDSLKFEYGDSLAVLVYHMRRLGGADTGDTLSPEEAQDRSEWYSVTAAPTALFDGESRLLGAATVQFAYNNYHNLIVTRRGVWSPFQISIDPSLTGQDIQVDCSVIPLNSISGELTLWLALLQDSVSFNGSRYDFVVRRIESRDFSPAGTDTFRTSFQFQNRWSNADLGIVAFVQNDETKSVLQAAVSEIESAPLEYLFRLTSLNDTSQMISPDSEAVFNFTLANTGPLTDVYELSIAVVDSVPGWLENFCFGGICVLPPAIGRLSLSPGEADSTISVHIIPRALRGSERVRFTVRSQGDSALTDSALLRAETEGSLRLIHVFDPMRFERKRSSILKSCADEGKGVPEWAVR